MTHVRLNVNSTIEQLKAFVTFAKDTASDFVDMPRMDFEEAFKLARSKYRLVEEEQNLRPKYFYRLGGDCDNQLTFLLSWFFAYSPTTLPRLFIVTADFPGKDFGHIFLAISENHNLNSINSLGQLVSLDPLPLPLLEDLKKIDNKQVTVYPVVNFLL